MDQLPFDIFVELSKHIQLRDLENLSKTCKHINSMSKLEPIWKQQCLRVVTPTQPTPNYFNTLKRLNLVPIYNFSLYLGGPSLTPFAYVKRSDLNNDNLLFASRLLLGSFLIIVNNRFEYQWAICMFYKANCPKVESKPIIREG